MGVTRPGGSWASHGPVEAGRHTARWKLGVTRPGGSCPCRADVELVFSSRHHTSGAMQQVFRVQNNSEQHTTQGLMLVREAFIQQDVRPRPSAACDAHKS
ncbi:hypothetical protein CgunFtcFv8_007803 [Champsocephalus gunnari]|uniref:Uncharacterized protein n=1 Tax=Champsocephalus gunnari TaxID=52237 RepID=A0AAN8CH53_CHAGU|nr:hypothetical protein CgunFtcFv8_007803 [Champsocephalus gunnari]